MGEPKALSVCSVVPSSAAKGKCASLMCEFTSPCFSHSPGGGRDTRHGTCSSYIHQSGTEAKCLELGVGRRAFALSYHFGQIVLE